MKPNLSLFNIERVQYSCSLPYDQTLAQQIKKVSKNDDPKAPVYFFTEYEKHETSKSIFSALAIIPKKDTEKIELQFVDSNFKFRKPKENPPPVADLIAVLSNVPPVQFNCVISYQYHKRDHVKTAVVLPMSMFASADWSFDTIEGLHLSKHVGKTSEYDIIMDKNDEGDLLVTTLFKKMFKIDEMTINTVIDKSLEISKKFVLKEEQIGTTK